MVVLYIQAKVYQFKEQVKTVRSFYSKPRFVLYDLALILSNIFFNPYRSCRKFNQRMKAKEIHSYGETPISTFSKLAEAVGLHSKDTYIELGSGRGLTCVWASEFTGCRAIGIEWVPLFAKFSKVLSKLFFIPVHFKNESMFTTDLSHASVVYLYSCQLWNKDLLKIPLDSLSKKAKLITISKPHPHFKIIQIIPVSFPWGDTFAFIQTKSII